MTTVGVSLRDRRDLPPCRRAFDGGAHMLSIERVRSRRYGRNSSA
jgi:hypothetical protein